MDQDDRQDGNANVSENTTPNTTASAPPYPSDREFSSSPDSLNPMTHTKSNIETPNGQSTIASAEINTIETATVGPEIEPATTAYASGNPQPSTMATPAQFSDDESAYQTNTNPLPQTEPVQAASPVLAATRFGDKKRMVLIIAAVVVLLAIIGGLAWWLLFGNNKEDTAISNTSDTSSSSTEQVKLGVALTVTDAIVEYSVDGNEWQAATKETQLKEGDFIRTGNESRAVLTLDDGSAIRLDSNTSIKLSSLSADDVQVEQLEGSVYSRVVPSERTYTVAIDQTTYQALGTAFITIKNQSENGVQVYQSSVKTSDSDESVSEGKQYYKNSGDASIQGKLTDVNIDALVDNAFVNWNLTQDESDTNFKEKLGILAKIKERSAEKEVERLAAEEQKKNVEAAAKAAQEKKQTEQKEKEKTSTETKAKVTRGEMKLNRFGKTFSWTYTGKAVHGYKLVYAKKASDAYFGNKNATAIYFGNINEMSGQLPKSEAIDGDYYVRVCAYTNGTESEACVDHSNVKEIEI